MHSLASSSAGTGLKSVTLMIVLSLLEFISVAISRTCQDQHFDGMAWIPSPRAVAMLRYCMNPRDRALLASNRFCKS
jgi:hypothetical protein